MDLGPTDIHIVPILVTEPITIIPTVPCKFN